MISSFLVSIMLLLAMLASAGHAARSGVRWADLIWLVGPFAALVLATRFLPTEMEWVGIGLMTMAAWRLVRAGSIVGSLLLAGVSAGLGAALYVQSGLDIWLAAVIALAAPLLAIWFAREPRFAGTQSRDFALLVVAWSAPVVAAAPGVLAGWRSARALNQMDEATAAGIPVWAWLVPLVALLIGGARGFWKRR
ncbi:MAG: hypothetical protein QM773_01470 [Hyphomonadaceae bacterium]